MNFLHAQFLTSAPSIRECPPDTGTEVAFAGRSNAGKSSAINTLCNSKLARTSKTPGRTQLINFFQWRDEQQRLVDLPGYGYAKVSQDIKAQWQHNLTTYLERRQSLRGWVVVMDCRHPMQAVDTQLINWAVAANLPTHLLLTKSDKISGGAAKSTLLKLEKQLHDASVDHLVTAQNFSALKKQGLNQLSEKIMAWLHD